MDDLKVLQQVEKALRAAGRDAPIAAPLPVATADPSLTPDEKIDFKIDGVDIVSQIGRGGQGRVFKGIQHSTGNAVAIKITLEGRFASSRARRRLEREAKTLAKLDHLHVVRLLHQGYTHNGAHYLMLPFIEGVTFEKYLKDPRRNRQELFSVLVQVVRAVHACHELGFIHRDLKPENILIDKHGFAHVLDFGLARPIADDWAVLTQVGSEPGSVMWSSPEQLNGHRTRVGRATDIYSLGVMLYQCLSGGRLPFPPSRSLFDTMQRILNSTPRPACDDPRLNAIVMQAISRDPGDRHFTAELLADAIEGIKSSRFSYRTIRRVKRATLALTGIGVAAVVCLSVGALRGESTPAGPPSMMIPPPAQVNKIGMRLAQMPRGWFWMGSNPEWNLERSEMPMHRVTMSSPFWIATTETTVGQWNAVMHGNIAGDADLPVVGRTPEEIQQFLVRLSKLDGRAYRLPTPTEWEYAARAGSAGKYGGAETLTTAAWVDENAGGVMHAVGKLAPNAWGLYDMLGNAEELCAADDTFKPSPGDTVISNYGPSLPVRGGSIDTPTRACTVTTQEITRSKVGSPDIGFRLVADSMSLKTAAATTRPVSAEAISVLK